MATLTKQTVIRDGLEATYASAAGGGDEFVNTGREFIHIKNASGGDITLTIVTQQTVDAEAVGDKTVIITLAEERFVGPFPKTVYSDSNEKVQLTYSGVTSLTIAILELTQL